MARVQDIDDMRNTPLAEGNLLSNIDVQQNFVEENDEEWEESHIRSLERQVLTELTDFHRRLLRQSGDGISQQSESVNEIYGVPETNNDPNPFVEEEEEDHSTTPSVIPLIDLDPETTDNTDSDEFRDAPLIYLDESDNDSNIISVEFSNVESANTSHPNYINYSSSSTYSTLPSFSSRYRHELQQLNNAYSRRLEAYLQAYDESVPLSSANENFFSPYSRYTISQSSFGGDTIYTPLHTGGTPIITPTAYITHDSYNPYQSYTYSLYQPIEVSNQFHFF